MWASTRRLIRSLSVAPVTTAKRAHIINTKGKTLRIRDEDQKALQQKRCQQLWSGRRQTPNKMKNGTPQLPNWSENFKTVALPEDRMVPWNAPAAGGSWGDSEGDGCFIWRTPVATKSVQRWMLIRKLDGNRNIVSELGFSFVLNDTKFCCFPLKQNKIQQLVKVTD